MTSPPDNHYKLHAWADVVSLLSLLPGQQRARVISRASACLESHLTSIPDQLALPTWQIRYINQVLGHELISEPRRRWRFGPDYGSMRVIGG